MSQTYPYMRRRVDPRDGPVCRPGTPEWIAWQEYYKTQGRWFSARAMEIYERQGSDWPVTTQWPPNITGTKDAVQK